MRRGSSRRAIQEACAEWPAYGFRRVTAELHAVGRIINPKKVMRIMKENGLSVQPRRRPATTDGNHDGPIFPNLARDVPPVAPNELWVADITYIAIATSPCRVAGPAAARLQCVPSR